MELRELTNDDSAAAARLMSEAFGRGRRPDAPAEPEAPKAASEGVRESLSLGIFDGARLVACSSTHHLQVVWEQQDLPLGGVAGVACTAEQRGRGHVGRLLRHSLIAMREDGEFLSGLYPFAYAFYRRHGWEWVGERRASTVPTREIPAYAEGRGVRCYDGAEALDLVRPVYDRWAARYRGMITRRGTRPNFWESALAHHDNRTTFVHVYHDPGSGAAEGYLTFRYPPGDEPGRVGDFFALTPAAYRGLLSVLHYYGTQLPKVNVDGPIDDPLPLHIMHHDLETRVRPLFMGRIVDIHGAFQALSPADAATGRLVVGVRDEVCDWNDGAFEIAWEGGAVTVSPSTRPAGVSLDIQSLSQAFWGHPHLGFLRSAGRVDVADEPQFTGLGALLPEKPCYLQDFF